MCYVPFFTMLSILILPTILWIIIPILPIGTWNLGQEMSKEGSQDLNPGNLTLYIGPFWIGTLPTNGEVATDEDSILS